MHLTLIEAGAARVVTFSNWWGAISSRLTTRGAVIVLDDDPRHGVFAVVVGFPAGVDWRKAEVSELIDGLLFNKRCDVEPLAPAVRAGGVATRSAAFILADGLVVDH